MTIKAIIFARYWHFSLPVLEDERHYRPRPDNDDYRACSKQGTDLAISTIKYCPQSLRLTNVCDLHQCRPLFEPS
jgi:hypothetical protein